MNPLFVSGYEFETPIPLVTREGVKPFPATGNRQLDARTTFFYGYIGITPAMAMHVTGIGSQYLLATLDANKHYFDGGKTYKVTLPKGIPEANFWSFTVYDTMTRSMLDAPQRYPRRQPELSLTRRGSQRRWLDDGVLRSDAARRGEARQLDPDRARQGLAGGPAPLQPARTVLHQGVAPERDRTGSDQPRPVHSVLPRVHWSHIPESGQLTGALR